MICAATQHQTASWHALANLVLCYGVDRRLRFCVPVGWNESVISSLHLLDKMFHFTKNVKCLKCSRLIFQVEGKLL